MTRRWRLVNGTELYDMASDPGQSLDVAAQNPEVVGSLRGVYERWWNGIEPTFADTPRIVVGSERQNMTRLVTRECLSSGLPAWSQSDVRLARHRAGDDCTWAVDVERAGEYIVELRRWPRELNHPIRGSVPPGEPVPGAPAHRDPPGAAYAAVRATLTIGSDTYTDSIDERDRSVLFDVSLQQGPTAITATFEDEDGKVLPSYYVYVYPAPSAATLAVESPPISSSGLQGWRQVDLGGPHDIESIVLRGCEANDCAEPLSDFYVFVAGENPVGRSLADLAGDPGIWRRYFIGEAGATLAVPVGTRGRYIRVQHSGEGVPPLVRVEARGTAVRAAGAGEASPRSVPVFADDIQATPQGTMNMNRHHALLVTALALIGGSAAPLAQDRPEPAPVPEPAPEPDSAPVPEPAPEPDSVPVPEPSVLMDYFTVGGVTLRAHVFEARTGEPPHPAILFFFGGGWTGGNPQQFYPFAEPLAELGFVAIPMEYRVRGRHDSTIPDSMADAFAAFRWARDNAEDLGIDPARIAVGGGSAGGHLAATVGTIAEHSGLGPSAMVLYNPLTDLRDVNIINRLNDLIGGDAAAVSPLAHIEAGAPRTIIFHGEDDATVPISQSEAFCEMMTAAGNQCELSRFAGVGHGFFNARQPAFEPVLMETIRFLLSGLDE